MLFFLGRSWVKVVNIDNQAFVLCLQFHSSHHQQERKQGEKSFCFHGNMFLSISYECHYFTNFNPFSER